MTGEANEKQVREALKRYIARPLYMQKSLYALFSFTQDMFDPREDIIQVGNHGARAQIRVGFDD